MAADWSSSEIFKRFYLRSPDEREFARAVVAALHELLASWNMFILYHKTANFPWWPIFSLGGLVSYHY